MPPRRRDDLQRVRRELVRLSQLGLELATYLKRTAETLARAVPFDGGCWHTVDPATLLITSHTTNLSGEGFAAVCRYEYLTDDVLKFSSLAGMTNPVGTLATATAGRLERSVRFRELYRPRGWAWELRASFDLDGETWGSAMLLRAEGRPDFEQHEERLVAALAPHVAHGLRLAMRPASSVDAGGDESPGVLVLDGRDTPETITPAAARWLDELADPEEGGVPPAVLAIATRARRSADVPGPPAHARVRTRSGRFLALHASLFDGTADGRVAVVVEPARPAEIGPLVVLAYGLTPRERDVLGHVLLGLPTKLVAARLGISPYTVQDHLRSIFEKTGATSRGDLAGRLFYDHVAPGLVHS